MSISNHRKHSPRPKREIQGSIENLAHEPAPRRPWKLGTTIAQDIVGQILSQFNWSDRYAIKGIIENVGIAKNTGKNFLEISQDSITMAMRSCSCQRGNYSSLCRGECFRQFEILIEQSLRVLSQQSFGQAKSGKAGL